MMNIVKALLLVLLASYNVESYPYGAGGCGEGKAALGRVHLRRFLGLRQVKSYTLAQKNIVVTLDATPLSSTPKAFAQGITYPIKVVGQNMKGLLFRVPDLMGDLLPGENTKIASVCKSPVVGITHTNAATKSSFSGSLKFTASKSYQIDVMVVFKNGYFSKSEYAYGKVEVTVA